MKKLRIGFLSTAAIGRKNWKAIFHSGNCVVSAVASRSLALSRSFIAECQREFAFEQTPAALGGYEELLASPEVDAIYFPLPTALRRDLVIRAAQNGKHVVCEKPCAGNAAELAEMIAACKTHSVQFMDGVMFMHGPRLPKLREILADGRSVGAIRRIASSFSFPGSADFFRGNIRVNGALEPAGCLGDLGWYSIRFALWALNWQMPRTVNARRLAASENLPGRPAAPTEFSAELFFDGGVSVAFYCSFVAGHQQWVQVSGQKGWLYLPDFVHPFNGYEPAFEVNRKTITVASGLKCPPDTDPSILGHGMSQDTLMWRNFAGQIFSGKPNEDWPAWSLQTQEVLDRCLQASEV